MGAVWKTDGASANGAYGSIPLLSANMQQKRLIKVKRAEVCKVFCNRCGMLCCKKKDEPPIVEHVEVNVAWGYYSKKDCERHSWDLCEGCYDKFVKTFIIPPKIE